MSILEKTARVAAIVLAALFIGLSLSGVVGAWWLNREAIDVALKGFGVIETGVGVVDAGVKRVDDLITKSRTEVRQAAETIDAVGEKAQANSPVLKALNGRLETTLAPRVAQMQQMLGPVRDALGRVGDALGMLNSLPILADRAPRLAALEETFNRLEELTADTTQLRATLQALAEQKGNVAAETVAALKGLTQRIDTRLGEVQTNVQKVRVRRCGGTGAAGPAQVAAAVRLQPAGAAGHADDGLDRLLAGRRHPAPPGTHATVCRLTSDAAVRVRVAAQGGSHDEEPVDFGGGANRHRPRGLSGSLVARRGPRPTASRDDRDRSGRHRRRRHERSRRGGRRLGHRRNHRPAHEVRPHRRHRRSGPVRPPRPAEGELPLWVRGYGLVDGPQVQAAPGSTQNLRAVTAPNARAAAQYYPAGYWLSLIRVPAKTEFPGTDGQRHRPGHPQPGRVVAKPEVRRVHGVSPAGHQRDARDPEGPRLVRLVARRLAAADPVRPGGPRHGQRDGPARAASVRPVRRVDRSHRGRRDAAGAAASAGRRAFKS